MENYDPGLGTETNFYCLWKGEVIMTRNEIEQLEKEKKEILKKLKKNKDYLRLQEIEVKLNTLYWDEFPM